MGFDQAVCADERLNTWPRSVIGEIRAVIATAFSAARFKASILNEFRKKLSLADLQKTLDWLNSPIGRQITFLEENAATSEAYTQMQQLALQLEKTPPLPERIKIIERLDSATKTTETSIRVAMNTQLAIAMAIAAALPREQQPSPDSLIAENKKNRHQVESVMRTQTYVSFLYMYRGLSDEELMQYISFASSPAGINYHHVGISGLEKAMLTAGYAWGEIIADILHHTRTKTDI
jgi:hypothetical protein